MNDDIDAGLHDLCRQINAKRDELAKAVNRLNDIMAHEGIDRRWHVHGAEVTIAVEEFVPGAKHICPDAVPECHEPDEGPIEKRATLIARLSDAAQSHPEHKDKLLEFAEMAARIPDKALFCGLVHSDLHATLTDLIKRGFSWHNTPDGCYPWYAAYMTLHSLGL